MPAKSPAQKRLMDAAAHNPAFAKKVGIPTKVAKEFSKESKGMTFQKGTEMRGEHPIQKKSLGGAKTVKMAKGGESKAMAKKEISFMEKKGAPKSMIKHEKAEYGLKSGGKAYAKGGGIEAKGKTKGKMVKMMRGGTCK